MSTYVITESCVGVKEGSCVNVCPAACIHTTPDAPQYYIDPDICIACEQCVIVCPVEAIFLDTEVPPQWQHYTEINAAFFRDNKAAQSIAADAAARMADAAQCYAEGAGLSVTVVVVDSLGQPLAVSHTGEAESSSEQAALNKACTAVSFQVSTHELAQTGIQPWHHRADGFDESRTMAVPGGIPIIEGPAVIGAIGVHGSPTPQGDIQCCRAGLAVLAFA